MGGGKNATDPGDEVAHSSQAAIKAASLASHQPAGLRRRRSALEPATGARTLAARRMALGGATGARGLRRQLGRHGGPDGGHCTVSTGNLSRTVLVLAALATTAVSETLNKESLR